MLSGIVLISATMLGACGSTESEVSDSRQTAVERGTPPETFVDPFGRTWVRGSTPVVYDQSKSTPQPVATDTGRPDLDIRNMTIEEATEALRPISLRGDYQYTLIESDAREFAKEIQEVARSESGTEGGVGELPGGQAIAEGSGEQSLDPSAPTAIIGNDDRYSINPLKGTFPWNNHAAMDQWGTCTATKMVNHHTAVTAAHCVHTGQSWKAPKAITFGGRNTVGRLCYGLTVPGCWDGSETSPACDYATIKFREGWGYCDLNTYDVGYLGWLAVAGGSVSGITGYVSGYPAEEMKPGWVYPELVYHYRSDGWAAFTYPDRVFYFVDATGGQSGAGLISYFGGNDHRVRGIHKGHHQGIYYSNQGRKMTSSLFSWLSANGGY